MLKTVYLQGPNYWKGETEWKQGSSFSSAYFTCHSVNWFVSPVSQNEPHLLCSLFLFLSLTTVGPTKSEIKHHYNFADR